MVSTKMFDLSGSVAVVTGGNGGIGRGIALGLGQAGSAVAVLAVIETNLNACFSLSKLAARSMVRQRLGKSSISLVSIPYSAQDFCLLTVLRRGLWCN